MYQTQKVTSSSAARLVHRFPFFYGWVILAVGTLGMIMTSPGQTYSVSIFIEHFIQDLNVSRSLVSTLYAVGTVAGSLALPAVGRQIDRRGPRFMVVVISALFGLACIYMGFVRGPLTLGLGFVAIRMFGQGSLGLVSQNVINQWWVQRRGTVMGISGLTLSLLGLGGFPGLINWLIPLFGWRASYILLGALLLLIMAPLGFIFFRETPERYGLQPDGASATEEEQQPPPAVAAPGIAAAASQMVAIGPRLAAAEQNWTLAEAVRTPAFWILAAASSVIAMLSTGLFFHMVGILADNGLSPAVAASIYLPIAVTTALVTLAGGVLVDRAPVQVVLAVALLLQAAALWMAQFLSTVPLAFVYGITLGTTMGLFHTVSAVTWARYFGRRHLGSISGVAATILVFGSALGPIPLGVARDQLGSYNTALALLALLPLALSVASLLLKQPQKRSQGS